MQTTLHHSGHADNFSPLFSHTDLKNKEAVLHSSPRSPKVCIFCMSLFVSTPDLDNQLIRSELLAIDMVPTQCSLLPTP